MLGINIKSVIQAHVYMCVNKLKQYKMKNGKQVEFQLTLTRN